MASFLQKLILMFKASDVQIVETVRNRREKSRDAVDIVGRYGYYKQVWLLLIGLVTPRQAWLLLVWFWLLLGRTKGNK